MSALKKIVIKIGTSTLTQGTSKLSRRYMLELARQISHLHEKGLQIIVVSSGAMAAGRELLQLPSIDRSLPSKQMFASVGQVQLMQIWTELFALFNIHIGQVLLTREDFSHRKRYLNARDTLSCLLQHRIIPIINENDTVATSEIRVGDNDNLSALVSNLIGAEKLILLTDQQGLYTSDPRHNPDARLIPTVKVIDDSILELGKGSSTSLGTGGMATKLEAAQLASRCGVSTVIASSSIPNVLIEIAEGNRIGTLFFPEISNRESRKRWLLSEKRQGSIFVDAGAATKISHGGASLLPSGIIKTEDKFDRGAIVHVIAPNGTTIATGITHYGNEEIQRLVGVHSKHIEDILGYCYASEVIHRSNMTRVNVQTEKE